MTEKTILWEGTPIEECSRMNLIAAVRHLMEREETRAAAHCPQPLHVKSEAVREQTGWRWYHSFHLKTTTVIAPNGTEYELRDGDITTQRVARLLNAMFDGLKAKYDLSSTESKA